VASNSVLSPFFGGYIQGGKDLRAPLVAVMGCLRFVGVNHRSLLQKSPIKELKGAFSCSYGVATISRRLKLQVSFAKEPYKRAYENSPAKETMFFVASRYGVATMSTHRSHPLDFKSKVSFACIGLFYRALLQKRPII